MRRGTHRIGDHLGPIATAIAFGLVSVVPVAWSLQVAPRASQLANSGTNVAPIDWQPMTASQAVMLAIVVVLPAATFGGFVGGAIRRGFPLLGSFLALTIGWMTGVIVLPLAADILDVPLRTAITCEANLRDDQPFGGATAYARSLSSSVIFLPLIAIPIVFLVLAKRWDTGQSLIPVFFAVLTHAGLHVGALVSQGALVPYVCLAIGVMLWSVWLRAHDPRWHRSRYGSIIPPS